MDYSDARQIIIDLRSQVDRVRRFGQHWSDGPFVRSALLKAMLWEWDPRGLVNSPFLNYQRWTELYATSRERVTLAVRDREEVREYPYSRLVDLVQHPDSQFPVAGPVTQYHLPPDLLQLTEASLAEYQRVKTRTFDGRAVRLSQLEAAGNHVYSCGIQLASYLQQVRTNLTLDFPLRSHSARRTLRELDAGDGGELTPLRDSQLANSIGVSTVVGYRENHEWFFFCKLRRADDGVAERMLGSASGVAELLPGQHVRDLLAFAESEIIRELYNETGLSCGQVVRLVPLAFCRELVRGGKPQFMFFVEIDPQVRVAFTEKFKRSAEGLGEFYDTWWHSASAHGRELSFEFAYNLLLTLEFLQIESHQPPRPIRLA